MVGGGAAADGAAAGLREAGFRGSIVMVAEEPLAPYERPPLSKGYLTGVVPRERLALRPASQYLELGVEILHARALSVDVARRVVAVDRGADLAYDVLLLATGAEAARIDGPGLYLRRLADADRLREVLDTGSVTIAGAGFVGCEVAASARSLGCSVSLLEALEAPMLRVLGPRLGAWLADVHRSRGVRLKLGATGQADLVAVGSRPRTELAEAAGLECDRGVLVDALGRTSAPDVFAAGDCARFWSPLYETHIRVEHFQTAGRHGFAVGRAMAGAKEPFAEAPWFWSDQYDLNLQYTGAGLPWDEELVRGEVGRPPFTVFQLAGGRLVGAVGVDDRHTVSRTRRVLEAGVAVERAQLEDAAFDLRTLLRGRK